MPDVLHTARTALLDAKRHVRAEIGRYPGPISGCDAQFNHLLDSRRRLERALAEIDRPEWIPTSRNPD